MKVTITAPKEIEISAVRILVPVRYGEEDIPNNFPLRNGEVWSAIVNMDTGKIQDWPIGKSATMHMKVCDEGAYSLIGAGGETLAEINDYVPHGVVPGEYGDYLVLNINDHGVITNWPKKPDVTEFFRHEC